MHVTADTVPAVAALLVIIVVVVTGHLLVKRIVRQRHMRSLHRRVARARRILHEHEKDGYRKVDRLLFQLGALQDEEAVEIALQETLEVAGDDVGPELRKVYDNLGVIDVYLENLARSPRWSERATAARALGQLGVVEAIPSLVQRLRDPHEDTETVKRAAALALGRMEADEAIPFLLAELAQPDDWASPRLAELLLAFGVKALGPLQEALENDESKNSRVWAAQILGRLRHAGATMALVNRLRDRAEQVRVSVAEALGAIGDRRAIPDLTRMALHDPVPTVRAEAARALGGIGDPSVLGELVLLLSSSDYWTRLRAVEAIEKLRPEDTQALEAALVDPSDVVHGEAARALERLGVLERRLEELASDDPATVATAREVIIQFGRAGAVDSLLERTWHSSLGVRARMCSALGEVGNQAAVPRLTELLEDPMWPVRARAAEAIGKLGPPNAVELLVPLLTEDEEMVRICAIGSLQRLGAGDLSDNLQALTELFERGGAESRCCVIESLRSASTEEIKPLVCQALEDPNPDVRLTAARETQRRPDEAWTPGLSALLADSDQRVRKEAARALGRMGSARAIEALAESLSTPDRDFREILTDMLAPQGPQRVLELVGPSPSAERRLALAWALGKTRDPEALPELQALAKDSDPRVRAAAGGAIAKIPSETSEIVLGELLRDPNERVRSAAINGAGNLRAIPLLPALLAMVNDPHDFVRGRLAVTLGLLEHEPAVAGLDRLAAQAVETVERAYVAIGYGLCGTERGVTLAVGALRDAELEAEVRRALAGERPEVRDRFRHRLSLQDPGAIDAVSAQGLRELYVNQLQNSREDEQRAAAVDMVSVLGIGDRLDVLTGAVAADPAFIVRRNVLRCLGPRIDDDRVAACFRRALRDPVPEVRLEAVRGVASADSPENNRDLLLCGAASEEPVVGEVIGALKRANAGRVADFLAELEAEPDERVLALGVRVLGEIGDSAVQHRLVEWLALRELDVRISAIHALGRLGTPTAREAILDCLQDPRVPMRLAVAEALARSPVGAALEGLMRLTRDPSVEVRSGLAHALTESSSGTAAEVAGSLAEDPEPAVRAAALIALLRIANPAAIERFHIAFPEQPAPVRRALSALPDDHAAVQRLCDAATGDAQAETRIVSLEALAMIDKRQVDTLVLAMQDPEPAVRIAAVTAARELDDPALHPIRKRLARDPVAEVRKAVRKGKLKVVRRRGSEE